MVGQVDDENAKRHGPLLLVVVLVVDDLASYYASNAICTAIRVDYTLQMHDTPA